MLIWQFHLATKMHRLADTNKKSYHQAPNFFENVSKMALPSEITTNIFGWVSFDVIARGFHSLGLKSERMHLCGVCVIVGPPRSSLGERRGGPFWSECIILIWGMLFVCSSNDIPRVTAHIYLPLAPIKSIYLYAPVSRSDHLLFIILIYSQSIIHFLQLSRRAEQGSPRPASALFGIQ